MLFVIDNLHAVTIDLSKIISQLSSAEVETVHLKKSTFWQKNWKILIERMMIHVVLGYC